MADDPKPPATPPKAAADKPASAAPAEPLKAEPSRTDSGSAGASAAPTAPKATPGAPAPKPAAPAAKQTAAQAEHVPKVAPPTGPPDPPPPETAVIPPFITSLRNAITGGVAALSLYLGDWTIIVPVAQLDAVARHLRDATDAQFDYLSDLTATDWPPRTTDGRFDVVYMLYSIRLRHRVRLKVKVGENQPIPSVTSIWPAANWFEREVYDMFGVNFTGHPDRRRILMPDDWQGFPQRKDYPLEGPGELLMENPLDWLKLRQAKEEAEIE
jgi:NADH-quinone oxidoreductase subunit C